MKTTREWIEDLDEPYRSEAIKNTPIKVLKLKEHISQSKALLDAFVWEDTPQGHDYWSDLHELISKKEENED